MHADGEGWEDLFIPQRENDLPPNFDTGGHPLGTLQMQGRKIYKFAVSRFPKLIEDTLQRAGLQPDEVDSYICHQSNARMLESARERIGIPEHKLPINIDRYGNCSGGSVPLLLDELREQGRCNPGETVMFVAFGGGLTWGSSLWQL
jgi:3-oxoacyl-[acyl-carrier-protein] synthase-3